MKYIFRTVVVGALLGLLAWGLAYVSSEGDAVRVNADWGIAKDHPMR